MTSSQPFRVHVDTDAVVDKLCDDYERHLKKGDDPPMDGYLRQVAEVDRQSLFRELLLIKLEYTPHAQQISLLESQLGGFPQYASVVCTVLAEIAHAKISHTDAALEPSAKQGTDPTQSPHGNTPLSFLDSSSTRIDQSHSAGELNGAGDKPLTHRQLSHYQIIDEVGSGAFGKVYRAYDTKLKRIVAIKILREDRTDCPDDKARFLREAYGAGGLDHPSIIKVHEVGEQGHTPFIVTEFVDGESLDKIVQRRRLGLREAVMIVLRIAEALEHAHARAVIHRDLKTANILIDKRGHARLTDFGLAKHDADTTTVTLDGNLLGTPAYMSPEQAEGGGHHADQRSDVFSLGVVLFELLTGELPFRGTPAAVLRQVAEEDAPAPSSLMQDINRDLDTICLKCLEKSPRDRYQSAAGLAEDLRRWLAGWPVTAQPVGVWGKCVRWCRRHQLSTVLLCAILLLAIGGSSILAWQWWQVRSANERLVWSYVEALRTASPELVPRIRAALDPHESSIQRELHAQLNLGDLADEERLRLSLILHTPTSAQLRYLETQALKAAPAELALLRDAQAASLRLSIPFFWQTWEDQMVSGPERLRAAAMLAGLEPTSPHWHAVANELNGLLLSTPPSELYTWLELFAQVVEALRPNLGELLSAEDQGTRRRAAQTLGYLVSGSPAKLAELLLDADREQFPEVLRMAQLAIDQRKLAQNDLVEELTRQPWRTATVRQRANQSLALANWRGIAPILPLLELGDDRSVRSAILPRLAEVIGADRLLQTLETTDRADVQQALLVTFAHPSPNRLSGVDSDRLLHIAMYLYENANHGGVHAAAEWLLRKLDCLPALALTSRTGDASNVAWYVSANGHTMIRVSPSATSIKESNNGLGEMLAVNHTFYLSSHEVTLRQFRQFMPDYRLRPNAPEVSEGPVVGITPAQAAQYCNWLSSQQGLPADQWCYPDGAIDATGRLIGPVSLLQRRGYRLPTPEEWQMACQAGAVTRYSFGNDSVNSLQYGWFLENSAGVPHAVGLLQPNEWGFFDMLGNAMELCPLLASMLAKDQPTALYFGGTITSNYQTINAQSAVPSFSLLGLSVGGFRVAQSCGLSIESVSEHSLPERNP